MAFGNWFKKKRTMSEVLQQEKIMEEMTPEEAFQHGEAYRAKDKTEKALEYYCYAGESGHRQSQDMCARWYELGIGCKADRNKAFYWLEKIAENGTSVDQLACAEKWRESTDLRQAEKVFYWTERAAKQGHIKAQISCGGMYDCSYGCMGDEEKALYWYEQAALQGNTRALYECACKYATENRPFTDEEKALIYYEKAMQQGHAYAKEDYERLRKNLEKRDKYRKTKDSIELSEVECMVLEGIRAAQDGDYRWAEEDFEKAAQLSGDGRYAAVAVNLCLDPNKYSFLGAESAAKLADKLGYPNAKELLCRVYVEIACYSENEYYHAEEEFSRAHLDLLNSNYKSFVNQCYNDPYVSRTRNNLLHYRRKAAALGHTWSLVSIAEILFWEYEITKNIRKLYEAAEMVQQAKAVGDEAARGYFGSYILEIYNAARGDECSENGETKEAVVHYREAAELGNVRCMYDLALLLYRDNDRNHLEEAHKWAEKAAAAGDKKAENLLNMIVVKMGVF